MKIEEMREHAKRAKGGDGEALQIVVLHAPRGMRGMSAEDFASKLAEDDGFASEVEGRSKGYDYAMEEEESDEEKEVSAERKSKAKEVASILESHGAPPDIASAAAEDVCDLFAKA